MPRRLGATAAVVFLCVLSLAWYRDCILTFFVTDDFWVMRDAARIAPGEVSGFFRVSHVGFQLYRPLTTVAYFYVLQELFHYDASGYHAVQLAIFTLNVVLVFAIALRMTGSIAAGLAIGILYLLAPGQGVGIYWLAAFTVTGTAFAVLLMIWSWLVTAPPWRVWICAALQAVALLCSEHAVTAPALIAIVTAATAPRSAWRRSAMDLAPAAALAAAYLALKAWYLAGRPPHPAYALSLDPRIWIEHVGHYAAVCINAVALLQPSDWAHGIVGAALLILLVFSVRQSVRGGSGWPLLAAGLGFFIVSLAPVLALRTYSKDHYIALAALGIGLAVVAACQLTTRRWRSLVLSIAAAVLILDVVTDGRAWRRNPMFHFVANGSLYSADWVYTVQRAADGDGSPQPVFVPWNAITATVFHKGQAQKYFPALPAEIFVLKPGQIPRRAGVVLKTFTPMPPDAPLPGWHARWDALRRLAGSTPVR